MSCIKIKVNKTIDPIYNNISHISEEPKFEYSNSWKSSKFCYSSKGASTQIISGKYLKIPLRIKLKITETIVLN